MESKHLFASGNWMIFVRSSGFSAPVFFEAGWRGRAAKGLRVSVGHFTANYIRIGVTRCWCGSNSGESLLGVEAWKKAPAFANFQFALRVGSMTLACSQGSRRFAPLASHFPASSFKKRENSILEKPARSFFSAAFSGTLTAVGQNITEQEIYTPSAELSHTHLSFSWGHS